MALDPKLLAQTKLKEHWLKLGSALTLCEAFTITRNGRDTVSGKPVYTKSAVETDLPFLFVRYSLTEIRQAQKDDQIDYSPEDRKLLIPFLMISQTITENTVIVDEAGEQWAARQPVELDPLEALYLIHARKTKIQI